MATHGDQELVTVQATGDLSSGCQYKVIDVVGTVSAANSSAGGILLNKPKLNEFATLCFAGHTKVYAGAAVSKGARVKTTTSGFAITVASGDGAFGKAINAANSGALFDVMCDFANAATTY